MLAVLRVDERRGFRVPRVDEHVHADAGLLGAHDELEVRARCKYDRAYTCALVIAKPSRVERLCRADAKAGRTPSKQQRKLRHRPRRLVAPAGRDARQPVSHLTLGHVTRVLDFVPPLARSCARGREQREEHARDAHPRATPFAFRYEKSREWTEFFILWEFPILR